MLFRLFWFIFIIVVLIAPFTFLSPVKKGEEEVATQAQKETKQPVKIVPKVIEKPLHSVNLPDFSLINDIPTKKKTFFNFIKPAIEQANQAILTKRERLLAIEEKLGLEIPLEKSDFEFIAENVRLYRVKGANTPFQRISMLKSKIDIVPIELVLVQAANESAWGTSRFARIGLNFFGIWCYKKGCGMVPNSRNSGANHEVEAFDSVQEAVNKYLRNINSNSAYVVFRSIRQQLREQDEPLAPEILATGLLPYSERGVDYVSEIIDMLRHNAKYFDVETQISA